MSAPAWQQPKDSKRKKFRKQLKKANLKIINSSFEQMRHQFAKIGLDLPHYAFVEVEELSLRERLKDLWHELFLKPAKWILKSMMFKIILIFFGTFVGAGCLVYYFEHVNGNKDQFVQIWDGIWWGIVTITTTGYGDKYPVTAGGRIIAGATMVIGIITAGIVTGNIASWLVDLRLKEARGLVSLAGKTGHLVICGWRREMGTVLTEILHLNPRLRPEDLVIIAPISQETLETFKSDERFNRVHILRGDYYTQTMLEHASIKYAHKVLILSDWSNPHASVTEVDAKTIMTAMTIEKIAPRVYVAAELIDLKFENYLRIAHCDEIIHSKEYSRALLANSAKSAGLAHIVYDLLHVDTPVYLATAKIPDEFVGRTFKEVVEHFKKIGSSIIIGLLENTGNLHQMKKEALSEAQKNPDTRTVLRNLKGVKHLTTNLPVLNPPRDYVIKKNTVAVLVENRNLKNSSHEVAS